MNKEKNIKVINFITFYKFLITVGLLGFKITLSFTNKEEYLYKYVTEHSSYSGFLKDVLKEKYQKEQKEKKKEKKNK